VSDFGTPGEYRQRSARTLKEQPQVRDSVLSGTDRANGKRDHAYAEIDSDRWRDWARDAKTHTLTHLDRYLEEAEKNLEANGVRVHWAETSADALTILRGIVREHDVRHVVKAKSMLTEELGVNEHLERLSVHVRETDLGEYIVQVLGQPPSHIVGPAMHLSLDDCRRLFHKRHPAQRPSELRPARIALSRPAKTSRVGGTVPPSGRDIGRRTMSAVADNATPRHPERPDTGTSRTS
jgi:L-lactate dehydrogenase complex protein LldF